MGQKPKSTFIPQRIFEDEKMRITQVGEGKDEGTFKYIAESIGINDVTVRFVLEEEYPLGTLFVLDGTTFKPLEQPRLEDFSSKKDKAIEKAEKLVSFGEEAVNFHNEFSTNP